MWNTISRLSAVAGGALWIVFAALAAGLPSGCTGDACLLQSHRDLGNLDALVIAGGLLILLALAQLAVHMRGPGAAVVAGGVAVMLAGVASGNWYVLVAGVAACTVGSAMLGIAVVRAGAAPRVGRRATRGGLARAVPGERPGRSGPARDPVRAGLDRCGRLRRRVAAGAR